MVGLLFVAVGILMVVAGAPLKLRKVPPNRIYGLRIPSTLRDEAVWYGANQTTGSFLLIVGLLTAGVAIGLELVPAVDQKTSAIVCVVVLLSGLALTAWKGIAVASRLASRPPHRGA